MRKFSSAAVLLGALLAPAFALEAEGPTFYAASPLEGELEPEFARAILKFHSGALADAFQSLEALLPKLSGPSASRDRRRILELEALVRSYQGDDARARALHEKILGIVKERGAPDSEAGPSVFALALIDLKDNKPAQAQVGFEYSHHLGYNQPACRFFLGYLDYKEGRLESSERLFRQVAASPVPAEIKAL